MTTPAHVAGGGGGVLVHLAPSFFLPDSTAKFRDGFDTGIKFCIYIPYKVITYSHEVVDQTYVR